MRYLVWVLRLLVFVIVLLFALKNTEPVQVSFFRRAYYSRRSADRRNAGRVYFRFGVGAAF